MSTLHILALRCTSAAKEQVNEVSFDVVLYCFFSTSETLPPSHSYSIIQCKSRILLPKE